MISIDFGLPAVMECKRCHEIREIDNGGVPCNPDHPYYHKWICDKCMDEIQSGADDTKQIRRGKWIPTEYDSYADGNPVYDAFECSECGHEHSGTVDTLTAYCPDCGAQMDRKEASKNAADQTT